VLPFRIRCLFDPWNRDPGRVKIQDPDPGSGMDNIPDHISKSLETTFWVKILKFIDADPDLGYGIFLTPDPGGKNQSCFCSI
jgi:hypothetical protein